MLEAGPPERFCAEGTLAVRSVRKDTEDSYAVEWTELKLRATSVLMCWLAGNVFWAFKRL